MLNRGIQDKVSVITSDNASNMTVAIEVAGVQKLGCLSLASNKALSLPLLQRVYCLPTLDQLILFSIKVTLPQRCFKKSN